MSKTKIIFLFLLVLCGQNFVCQNFQWAVGMGGFSYDYEGGLCVDVNGNVYSTGSFSTTADFDPGTGTFNLISNGAGDIYILKLDINGSFVWGKSVGGVKGDGGTAVRVDNSGNVYATGIFDSIVDFDPGPGTYTLDTYGSNKAFILKLDSNGNFVWAKCLEGSSNSSIGKDLALDNTGKVYITGNFFGTADFDSSPSVYNLTSGTSGNTFILKIDGAGNFVFAKHFFSASSNDGNSIIIDSAGNIYTVGKFSGTADFNPGSGSFNMTFVNWNDIFISKLDITGNFLWAKQIGGTWEDIAHSIKTDATGNIYVTGEYQDVVDFDPGPGTYTMSSVSTGFPNANDIFILKLDNNGNLIYAKSIGGAGEDIGYSIDVDNLGNTYTTGTFMNTPDFDPGPGTYTISSVGLMNSYTLMLDPSGNFVWVYTLLANFWSIAVDANSIYVSGNFGGTQDFDPGSGTYNVTAHGAYGDIFIQKLSIPCSAASPLSVVSTSSVICASGSATLNVSGANTYTWSTGSNSSSIIVTPTATTSYTVDGTTVNGCLLNSVFTQSVSACIGIKEFELEKIKIYPNPSSETLNISTFKSEFQNSEIEIINYLAQIILKLPYSNTIDVSSLTQGIYTLKITTSEQQSFYSKFVKQ